MIGRSRSSAAISFIKGLIPGTILTWLLALVMGSNQTKGGFLNIFHTYIAGYSFYWSWPLFIVATALAWAIFWMME